MKKNRNRPLKVHLRAQIPVKIGVCYFFEPDLSLQVLEPRSQPKTAKKKPETYPPPQFHPLFISPDMPWPRQSSEPVSRPIRRDAPKCARRCHRQTGAEECSLCVTNRVRAWVVVLMFSVFFFRKGPSPSPGCEPCPCPVGAALAGGEEAALLASRPGRTRFTCKPIGR